MYIKGTGRRQCLHPATLKISDSSIESVTTVWHRVVSDRPGRVTVTRHYLIEEAAILVLRNDFHTGSTAGHITQGNGSAPRRDRTVKLVRSPVILVGSRKINMTNIPA